MAARFNSKDTSNSEMNNLVPRSSNVVCVDEFGAKGDGENDDTRVNLHCVYVLKHYLMFVFCQW